MYVHVHVCTHLQNIYIFLSFIAPTAPTNVQAVVVNATAITVQWEEPETDNGIIRGYSIRYDIFAFNVSADTRSVTVGDLSPHTLYVFEVSAFTIEAGPNATASATTDEAGINVHYKARPTMLLTPSYCMH